MKSLEEIEDFLEEVADSIKIRETPIEFIKGKLGVLSYEVFIRRNSGQKEFLVELALPSENVVGIGKHENEIESAFMMAFDDIQSELDVKVKEIYDQMMAVDELCIDVCGEAYLVPENEVDVEDIEVDIEGNDGD